MAEKEHTTNYAVNPDKETLTQYEHCYSQTYVKKASLMPDAHVGYVAPIGAVLATKDYVVPSWVGFDIGCGMTTAKLTNIQEKEIEKHKETIYKEVKRSVPMGLGNIHKKNEDVNENTRNKFKTLLEQFMKGPHDKKILDYIQNTAIRHLGTLGHGNHFIELGIDKDKQLWITIHSGSRGIGHEIATRYMKKSANKKTGYEETHPLRIESDIGKEYMNILAFGLEFALLNRTEILQQTITHIENVLGKKVDYETWANKNHNHAIQEGEHIIHRKGATPAHKGERGVIPANMRDGCYLVEGKGSEAFIHSSSHGAGRILGRKEAGKKITMKEYKEAMKGIQGTVSEGTLDEAPMAYKDISTVMEAQKESVKVVGHIRPLINWKGEKRTTNR